MTDGAVEEKYKPFWQKDGEVPISQSSSEAKASVEISDDSSEHGKSFFDDMPKYVEGTSSELPKSSKKKKKKKSSIVVYDTKDKSESSGGIGFMNIAVAAIGIGVVLAVGYMVISQVQQAMPELNTTEIGGASASTIINGGFALVGVGIIVLAAFGLINVFGGSNGD